MLWLLKIHLRKLAWALIVLLAVGMLYGVLSQSKTPAMTYSLFLFILAFPLCSTAFENAVLELKNPISRNEYSLALLLSYLLVLLIPLAPFLLTKNFLSAVLVVVSGVSAGLFFGSLGVGPKLSAVLPILFLITFINIKLSGLSPILSLWNPLISLYKGISCQLASIGFYSLLYFLVMKKREWRV